MSERPTALVTNRTAPTRRGVSVRVRLLAIALLPTVIVLPALLGFGLLWWTAQFDHLLITKVNGDLTIARQYFNRIMERSDESLKAIGESAAFEVIEQGGSKAEIGTFLEAHRQALGLDFLYLVGANGNAVAAAPSPTRSTDQRRWPVVAAALAGKTSTVVDIFSGDDLSALSEDLAARARLDLIPTPAATPTERTVESRGMMIHSASPVVLPDGSPGALVAGELLNQNLAFIDTINDLVYKPASLPEGSQGTATLFLDDVRVSTNVRLFGDRRALGTRVSSIVRKAVLDDGRTWLDRAFVVNDWYISAYEPIVDSFGKRVGMLYVGFLEQPFRQMKHTTVAVIVAAFAIMAGVLVPLFLRWTARIFRPLEQMNETISQVESGDLGARTGTIASGDEIGRVSHHLDTLFDRLQARDRELREWTLVLDDRVAARTRELQAANTRLEATQRQLVVSEKLAAIGEITAGVAHEINNPIAVIQGNLDVARELLGPAVEDVRTEFTLIDQQVHRINLIVTKLLQFAKPAEFAGYVERVVPAEVITDCLVLIQHVLNKAKIEVVREDQATRMAAVNRTELQQVVINLLVNAVHAMPESGRLTLRSVDRDADGKPGVAIEVEDTGIGMSAEHLKRVFDAFFTTKPQHGTGLGLSISYTLVSRAGGFMSAASTLGKGSTFTIWLPEAAELESGNQENDDSESA